MIIHYVSWDSKAMQNRLLAQDVNTSFLPRKGDKIKIDDVEHSIQSIVITPSIDNGLVFDHSVVVYLS